MSFSTTNTIQTRSRTRLHLQHHGQPSPGTTFINSNFATPASPIRHGCSLIGYMRRRREAAPEPEDVRHLGIDYEMEDCVMGLTRVGLSEQKDAGVARPWDFWGCDGDECGEEELETGGQGGGGGERGDEGCGGVYGSVGEFSPIYHSVEGDYCSIPHQMIDGDLTTMRITNSDDNLDDVACYLPLQELYAGPDPCFSSTPPSDSSTVNTRDYDRDAVRRRYQVLRNQNRMNILSSYIDNLHIAAHPSDTQTCHTDGRDGDDEEVKGYITWLHQRLIKARYENESLGKVDEEFYARFGLDMLDLEGALRLCFEYGFGCEEGGFRWVG